jgi:hypothetical protein
LDARNNYVAAGLFHAAELKLTRPKKWLDKVSSAYWWTSLGYQAGSDFGNSIGRPIACFTVAMLALVALADEVGSVARKDEELHGWQAQSCLHGLRAETADRSEPDSRGRILAMMGRCDEARPLPDKVCGSGEPFVRMHAHYGSIDIAWGLNDIAQASVHLDMATRLAESSGHPSWMATCDNYAGLVRTMRGEYSLAIETLTGALEKLRRISRKVQETRVLADLAYAQLCAGLKDQARLTAEEAASSARRRGMKVWLAYAEWVMGGPTSTAFKKLVAETGAELLMRLPYPRT